MDYVTCEKEGGKERIMSPVDNSVLAIHVNTLVICFSHRLTHSAVNAFWVHNVMGELVVYDLILKRACSLRATRCSPTP